MEEDWNSYSISILIRIWQLEIIKKRFKSNRFAAYRNISFTKIRYNFANCIIGGKINEQPWLVADYSKWLIEFVGKRETIDRF